MMLSSRHYFWHNPELLRAYMQEELKLMREHQQRIVLRICEQHVGDRLIGTHALKGQDSSNRGYNCICIANSDKHLTHNIFDSWATTLWAESGVALHSVKL